MIDLSNNNGTVDFRRLYASGFRRVYLKRTEGVHFVDGKHDAYRKAALAAGLKVGEYHFARPDENPPKAEAEFFCAHLPPLKAPHALRPCLDIEEGKPSRAIGVWAEHFIRHVRELTGRRVVVYSNPWYLGECAFPTIPGPLWLASYGRNDGKEYPFQVPRPWKHAAAHQYTSVARVAGVQGPCDLSHVLRPFELDVHRWPLH